MCILHKLSKSLKTFVVNCAGTAQQDVLFRFIICAPKIAGTRKLEREKDGTIMLINRFYRRNYSGSHTTAQGLMEG